jgi:hypothetical protein
MDQSVRTRLERVGELAIGEREQHHVDVDGLAVRFREGLIDGAQDLLAKHDECITLGGERHVGAVRARRLHREHALKDELLELLRARHVERGAGG